jgi:predicted N-formylglutamate amidohydrolase
MTASRPILPVHTEPSESSEVLLVCEHASNAVPDGVDLGVSDEVLQAHVAWDPGALELAKAIAERIEAPLIHGGVSRLVYDCNRPPEAADAIPAQSEVFTIPGNQDLTQAERQARIDGVYHPFHMRLEDELKARADLQAFVTIHSFTRVYKGLPRSVGIGILNGADTRLADAMMRTRPAFHAPIRANEPYSAADGVAHTLDRHGAASGLPNVMIEVRNDLLEGAAAVARMADLLAPWITGAVAQLMTDSAA